MIYTYAKQAKLYYKLHLVLGLTLSSKLNLDLVNVLPNINNSSRLSIAQNWRTHSLLSAIV